jgi:hypothetical protein
MYDLRTVNCIAGSLYLAMLFLAFINSMSVQTPVSFDRGVSYRETAAGMYGHLPFALAACTVEVPYILLQVTHQFLPRFLSAVATLSTRATIT